MTAQSTPGDDRTASPWRWVPSLYFGQGIPYIAVMALSVIVYKNLGVSNTDIALYTSWLYLPWVVKPLWSPLVDMFGRKRHWVVAMQFVTGAALAMVALTLPLDHAFQLTLAVFWLIAFASATHDIAADGYYLLALRPHQQAAFVGVRSACFRAANIAGQGALVWWAGRLMQAGSDPAAAWRQVFLLLAAAFAALAAYHAWVLPRPASDHAVRGDDATGAAAVWREFLVSFRSFFARRDIALVLAFLLTFRLGEAQALKLLTPFLLDARSAGGLALTTAQVGEVYGVIGVAALTVGGILGGVAIAGAGLRRWLWAMLLAVHVPNLAYVYLAATQPESLTLIATAVAIEQFGYGFGFAAYLMFMILTAEGPRKTAHYAICTGFMALGMMLPGMVSGWIQAQLGYTGFFVWVCIATLPSLLVAAFLRIDPAFGRREPATGGAGTAGAR